MYIFRAAFNGFVFFCCTQTLVSNERATLLFLKPLADCSPYNLQVVRLFVILEDVRCIAGSQIVNPKPKTRKSVNSHIVDTTSPESALPAPAGEVPAAALAEPSDFDDAALFSRTLERVRALVESTGGKFVESTIPTAEVPPLASAVLRLRELQNKRTDTLKKVGLQGKRVAIQEWYEGAVAAAGH